MLRHLVPFLCLAITVAAPTGNVIAAEPQATPPATASGSLIADVLAFGNPDQENAHRLTVTGQVVSEYLDTEIGSFQRRYGVRTLTGIGSSLSFTMSRPSGASDLVLEFQEIHIRRPRAHGYAVAINGVDAYFRTYDEIGAGPNHFFVRVPAAALVPGKDLTVTVTSAGNQPFSLGQVWLYGDFFAVADRQEQVYRPMAMMGQSLDSITETTTSFAPLGVYEDHINFGNRPKAAVQKIVRHRLEESGETGKPLELLFNGPSWGGAPGGPDGQGGYFTDIRYSALGFNPATRAYCPSYPNMWGNTFWSSYAEPHMRNLLKERFLDSLGITADTVDILRAHGKPPQVVYARDLGMPLGELTDANVRAAAKDGITLDPADGLSDAERLWLHRSDVGIWRDYATWHAQLFPRDAVVVDRGAVRPPEELAIDNQYSHTIFTTAGGPMLSRRWFGGQTGMVEGFWSSGEVFFDRFAQYDYVKANGKLGHVNIWAPFAKTPDTLRSLYDAGFRFAAVIGDIEKRHPEYVKLIRETILAADRCDDLPALAPPQQDPTLLEGLYNLRREPGPADRIVGIDNLRIHSQCRDNSDMAPVSRLAVSEPGRPGSITYRIDNEGDTFTAPLSMYVDGRIAPGAGNRIEVMVGETEADLKPAITLTDAQLPCPDHWELYMNTKTTVDLGSALVGRKSGLVRLVFHAEHASDATFLLECRISTQWPRRGGPLADNTFTMRQQRTLNLWIQERAVAEHMLARHLRMVGDDAAAAEGRRLVREGRYRSAQRHLSAELAQMLPTRFAVRGHGRLGRQPIDMTLPGENQVLLATVHAATATSCEMTVRGEQARQPFRISMPAPDRSTWTLTALASDRFRLTQDPAGTLVASNGRIEADAEAVHPTTAAVTMPSKLVARYLEGNDKTITVDCQDLRLMAGASSIKLPLIPKAAITRTAERLTATGNQTAPQRHDRVELSIDAQGRVTAIAASYGRDQGRIARVIPLSPMQPFCNGAIELDNGNRYEFDFTTAVDTPALQGHARAYEWPMVERSLRTGEPITVDYSPFTELGGTRRITRIHQPSRVLLAQDFTKSQGDDWRKACVSASDVVVASHNVEPHNGKTMNVVMRPTRAFLPGTVTYQITSERALRATYATFSARAFDDSSSVEFAVSTDGGTSWTTCGRFDNSWQNSYPQGIRDWNIPSQSIDLTAAVAGKQEFLLRATLRVNAADERFALGRIGVMTAD